MQKIILTKKNLSDIIQSNKYRVLDNMRLLSRCIDGRYKNSVNLPALAIPGGDAGELMLIFATANSYGFTVDREEALKTLIEIVGGEKNLQFHTDSHADKKGVLGGCGHINQASQAMDEYNITQGDIDFIKTSFNKAVEKGAKEIELQGDHNEGAVVLIKGNYGLLPQGEIIDGMNAKKVQIFVFHDTLVNARNKILAKKLIENKALNLFDGCDEEYLYEVLSTITEEHLMETTRRLAKGLPIYEVKFDINGEFEVESLGNV